MRGSHAFRSADPRCIRDPSVPCRRAADGEGRLKTKSDGDLRGDQTTEPTATQKGNLTKILHKLHNGGRSGRDYSKKGHKQFDALQEEEQKVLL